MTTQPLESFSDGFENPNLARTLVLIRKVSEEAKALDLNHSRLRREVIMQGVVVLRFVAISHFKQPFEQPAIWWWQLAGRANGRLNQPVQRNGNTLYRQFCAVGVFPNDVLAYVHF
jgi:hypothetical protein